MKKFIGAFTALAFAVTASAQTSNAELEAQIAELTAQLTALLGGTTTTVAAPSTCGTFTQTLTLGSTGAEVEALQDFLVSQGTLTIPAGVAKGYFGGLTQSALASYQATAGIAPAVGYFGVQTRAQVNGACATTTVVVTTPGATTTGSTSTLSGSEASLEDLNLRKRDSDVAEGDEAEVAVIEFDVEDGDVRVERLDLTFVFDNTDEEVLTGENEPWDALETITLLVDGDEIASEDVSDEDDWLDEDTPFVFRFTGLDYMVEEGDKAEITVVVEVAGSVDDAADAGINDWTIYVAADDIRALDASGIDQYIGDAAETVTFGIESEEGDEALTIKSSSDDPEASILLVDANNDSEWHEVFVFKIEGEDHDIDLEDLVLEFTTADTGAGTGFYEDIVSDITIEIDGEEFTDFDVVDAGTLTADVTFDIDEDFTIDEDDTVEVVVMVEFFATDNYGSGTTTVAIKASSVSGEGVDDVSDTSSIASETHTLSESVADISSVTWATSETDTTGVIDLLFTVTAGEEDFDVLAADIDDTATGVAFTDTVGTPETTALGILTRVSGDDVVAIGTTGFTVAEGDEVRFRVRYNAAGAGAYEVSTESIGGQELADDDQLSPTIILEAAV
jgi:hypothetical protein